MKNLTLWALLLLLVALPVSANSDEHYGSKIPTLPEDGVLYHADTVDCNPEDMDADDPHFFVALGYYWDDMFAAVFYRNDAIEESGLSNPTVLFYGSDESPTIFVRIGDTVERFEGFEEFLEKYPESLCDLPRYEI